MAKHHIRVVELFAGVGGFRIGLEGASDAFETVPSRFYLMDARPACAGSCSDIRRCTGRLFQKYFK